MATHKRQYQASGGDVLEVEWNGNVWVAPSCGAQYAHASDAMRQELAEYLRASGETVEDVADLDLESAGAWIE